MIKLVDDVLWRSPVGAARNCAGVGRSFPEFSRPRLGLVAPGVVVKRAFSLLSSDLWLTVIGLLVGGRRLVSSR